jgi:hypothetical protein
MPSLASLVLTDRATTPVAHTFTPNAIKNDVAVLSESSGVPVGDKQLTIGWRKSPTRRRASLKLALPVVQTQTINGISTPVVVRTAYANVEFNFDATSSTQERNDCVGMLYTALATSQTLIAKTVVDLEAIY